MPAPSRARTTRFLKRIGHPFLPSLCPRTGPVARGAAARLSCVPISLNAMGLNPADDPLLWRPLSLLATLRDAPRSRPARFLLAAWGLTVILCIALGVYQVQLAWNGIPI